MNRYGRRHKGYYPEWSANKPVNLTGHSQGSPSLLVLQQLLETNHITGLLRDDNGIPYKTSSRWLKVLMLVSGSHNGSLFPHYLGNMRRGYLAYEPGDRFFSIIGILFMTIKNLDKLLQYTNIPFLSDLLDLAMDHRNTDSFKLVSNPSKNCSYIGSLSMLNKEYLREIVYREYITYIHIISITTKPDIHINNNKILFHTYTNFTDFLFKYTSMIIGHMKQVERQDLFPKDFKIEEWRETDGLASIRTQDLINNNFDSDRLITVETADEMLNIHNNSKKYQNKIIRYIVRNTDHLQTSVYGIILSPSLEQLNNYYKWGLSLSFFYDRFDL